MLKPLFLAAALASAAALTGCQSMQAPPQMTENLQQLQNRSWIATHIGNTEIKASPAARSVPSIQFDEAFGVALVVDAVLLEGHVRH